MSTGGTHADRGGVVPPAIPQAKDALANAGGTAGETASSTADAARGRVQDVRTAVSSLGDTAEQARARAAEQLGQQRDQARQVVGQSVTQAGTQLTDFGGSLRDKARTLGDSSPLTTAAAKAADALEGAGGYLQATGPDDWVTDLKRQIERRPLAAVMIALVLGFLLARTAGSPRTIVITRDYPPAPAVLPSEA